jgi:hypothetical protein
MPTIRSHGATPNSELQTGVVNSELSEKWKMENGKFMICHWGLSAEGSTRAVGSKFQGTHVMHMAFECNWITFSSPDTH